MVSLVLKRHPVIWPSEIDPGKDAPALVADLMIDFRRREPGSENQGAQYRFSIRFGSIGQ
jgi:hypothetical protein